MAMGERVARLRRRRAWSQEDLAREAKVSPNTVSRLEATSIEPRPSTVRKLAEALGVSPAELFGDDADDSVKR